MASACIFASLLITTVPVLAKIEIQFTKWPEPVMAAAGSTKSFECAVQVPAEKFVWRTFESMEDAKSWRNVSASDVNSTMSKLLVSVSDNTPNSWYQCVVSYGAMTLASVPARLTVARLDLSQNTHAQRVLYAPVNNDVALHCRPPLSDPPAVLTWWKEERGRKKHLASSHGVLVLRNVTLEDSGTYRCTATNELSGQVADLPERTYLQVQHEGHTTPSFLEPEEYVGTMKNDMLTKMLYPDQHLSLWCGVIGNPQPRVQWSRKSHHHQVTQLTSKADGQALVVAPFKKGDEGIYSCSTDNIRRAWLVVRYQEPMWDGAAKGMNASEGHPARISCGSPRAVPTPAVYWLLNSELLVPGRGIRMTDRELHIESVEKRHAGVVQCVACNERACAYDAALLTVEPAQISKAGYSDDFEKTDNFIPQPPKRHSRKNSKKQASQPIPPSRPNVTRISDNSVMVTWSVPTAGMPIRFYKVQYREISNNSNNAWNTENLDIHCNIHSYLIDGLEPDKYYRFRISAVYSNQDNKQGKTSAKFYLQRGGFQKPTTPILTSAVSFAPTEIMLNWTWSSGAGPKNEGFYVYYRVLSTAGEYDKVWAAPDARTLRVGHLQPDVAYELKIQAYTEQAPSDFSAILKAKTMRGTTVAPAVVPAAPEVSRRSGALVPAAGALGAALLLAAAVSALLLCRRARRPPLKEKNSRADSNAGNGYIPAKVPITITANPMHNEAGDSAVEMSYMHNNNCGTNTVDDNATHNRKSTRNYV